MADNWDSGAEPRRRREHRSLFWPVVFIGAGVIFLLDSVGAFPPGVSPWEVMFRYWPLILILIGVDILFGRAESPLSRLIGAVLALALVGAVILLVFVAPPGASRLTRETRNVPSAGAESATVEIDFGDYSGAVESMRSDGDLLVADLGYYGSLRFDVREAGSRKDVSIAPGSGNAGGWLGWLDWAVGSDREGAAWRIQMAEDVRFESLKLTLDDGAGAFNLARLRLDDLRIVGDDAPVDLRLPGALRAGEIRVDDASVTIRLPELASDVGVQITVRLDDGQVENANESLERVRESGNGGVWETDDYDRAERKLRLDVIGNDARVRFE